MQQLTEKQKKAAWIIAGVLVLIHYLPNIAHTAMHAIPARPHRSVTVPVTPSVAKPATSMPAVTPTMLPQLQAKFLGVWEETQYLPNDDVCHVRLELRLSQEHPGSISGYETRTCFNLPGSLRDKIQAEKKEFKVATPVSTLLTGSPDGDDIAFQVDRTIGSSPFVCPLASYTVSSFGQKSIVAQWRAVDCPAGEMMLTRIGG